MRQCLISWEQELALAIYSKVDETERLIVKESFKEVFTTPPRGRVHAAAYSNFNNYFGD